MAKKDNSIIIVDGVKFALAEDGCYHPIIIDKPASVKGTPKPSSRKGDDKVKVKVNIEDYKPNCNHWGSYNSKRTKYAYAVATNGEVTDGKPYGTKWYGKIDFSENGAYHKAKVAFEKHYGKYIPKADR